MRMLVLSCLCCVAFAGARANAQVDSQPSPAPVVDAAHETWFTNLEPLLMDGYVYLPSGPMRFFDPNVMVRTGAYRGIPVYQDTTIEPSSIIYVPAGGGQMRPYERRRAGDLADTTGSRAPSFPVEPEAAASDEERLAAAAAKTSSGAAAGVATPAPEAVPQPAPAVPPVTAAIRPRSAPENPPAAKGTSGIFIDFDGARWYSSGRPVSFSSLFQPVGSYDGFVVYRLKTDHHDRIWVPVVAGGPLAPYSKR
jgi:hypothetical protein